MFVTFPVPMFTTVLSMSSRSIASLQARHDDPAKMALYLLIGERLALAVGVENSQPPGQQDVEEADAIAVPSTYPRVAIR